MHRHRHSRSKFRAAHKTWRIDLAVSAVQRIPETVESKINRQISPWCLLHGVKSRFRKISNAHADVRIYLQKAFVCQTSKIQAEPVEIIAQKNRASYLGVNRVAVSVRKRQSKRQRRKLVVVRNESPPRRQLRLDFQPLLLAALRLAYSAD